MRWLPHIYYTSMQGSPAAQMGLYPQGSPIHGNDGHASTHACGVRGENRFSLYQAQGRGRPPGRAKESAAVVPAPYKKLLTKARWPLWGLNTRPGWPVSSTRKTAGIFLEKVLVIIENRGVWTMGQWCNRFTLAVRAPRNEFAVWGACLAYDFRFIQAQSQLGGPGGAGNGSARRDRPEDATTDSGDRPVHCEHRSRMNSEIKQRHVSESDRSGGVCQPLYR